MKNLIFAIAALVLCATATLADDQRDESFIQYESPAKASSVTPHQKNFKGVKSSTLVQQRGAVQVPLIYYVLDDLTVEESGQDTIHYDTQQDRDNTVLGKLLAHFSCPKERASAVAHVFGTLSHLNNGTDEGIGGGGNNGQITLANEKMEFKGSVSFDPGPTSTVHYERFTIDFDDVADQHQLNQNILANIQNRYRIFKALPFTLAESFGLFRNTTSSATPAAQRAQVYMKFVEALPLAAEQKLNAFGATMFVEQGQTESFGSISSVDIADGSRIILATWSGPLTLKEGQTEIAIPVTFVDDGTPGVHYARVVKVNSQKCWVKLEITDTIKRPFKVRLGEEVKTF